MILSVGQYYTSLALERVGSWDLELYFFLISKDPYVEKGRSLPVGCRLYPTKT